MRAWLAAFLLLLPALARGEELTIATFNTEFLTRPKVHVKFGFPFDLVEQADLAIWNAPGIRDQKFAEGAAAVAKVVAGIKADVLVLTEVGDERGRACDRGRGPQRRAGRADLAPHPRLGRHLAGSDPDRQLRLLQGHRPGFPVDLRVPGRAQPDRPHSDLALDQGDREG